MYHYLLHVGCLYYKMMCDKHHKKGYRFHVDDTMYSSLPRLSLPQLPLQLSDESWRYI